MTGTETLTDRHSPKQRQKGRILRRSRQGGNSEEAEREGTELRQKGRAPGIRTSIPRRRAIKREIAYEKSHFLSDINGFWPAN